MRQGARSAVRDGAKMSFAEMQARIEALETEVVAGREREAATVEVLQAINSSQGDLAPVFDTMLERAVRLCEAAFGLLWTYDGENFHQAAMRGVPPQWAEFLT